MTLDEKSKYSVTIKEALERKEYIKSYFDFSQIAEVAFEYSTLYSFTKVFDKRYIIKIGCNCESATPLDPVTYTIFYVDGSSEWGVVPNVNMAHNPDGNIESIENHAENAFNFKTLNK